jgi:hypothetical protein
MLKYILEYILGKLELLSFNLLVNSYFNIQIFKLNDGLLIPLCKPFEIEVIDACDINIDSLCDNIKWNDEAINNLNNSDNILILIFIKGKGDNSRG